MSTNPLKSYLNKNGTRLYLKECKKHGLTEHYKYKRKDRKNGYSYHCLLCNVNSDNNLLIKNRNFLINYTGGKCIHCGYNKCFNSLECHHLNPNEKEYQISEIMYKSTDFIKKELDKCILLCSNCHRIEHSKKEILDNRYNRHTWKYRHLLHNFNGNKCFICGNNNIYNVAYHHIDPKTKKFMISIGITKGYSLERLIEESKKCVLLCHNCHKEYHSGEFHQNIQFISTLNFDKYIEHLQEEQDKKKQPIECGFCGELTLNDKYCSYKHFNKKTKEINEETKNNLNYLIKKHTLQQIGDMYGVSGNAVKKWCIKYNIKYKDKRKYKPLLSKEELLKELEELSMTKIAKKYKTSRPTISKMCRYYNVKSTHIN